MTPDNITQGQLDKIREWAIKEGIATADGRMPVQNALYLISQANDFGLTAAATFIAQQVNAMKVDLTGACRNLKSRHPNSSFNC